MPWQEIPNGQARFFKLSRKPLQFGLQIRLAPEWHTYWLNPGDSGAAPLIYGLNQEGKTALPLVYPFPERLLAPPLVTYGYSQRVIYFFDVDTKKFQGLKAEVLVCKEECIPGFIENTFSQFQPLNFQERDFEKVLSEQRGRLPVDLKVEASYSTSLTGPRWEVNLPEGHRLEEIFWYPEQVTSLEMPEWLEEGSERFLFYSKILPLSDQSSKKKALLVVSQKGKKKAVDVEFVQRAPSVWPFLFMALFGGLILNLMPCVFPIVSLKAFAIAKSSGQKKSEIRRESLLYSLGVIVSFVLLALVISGLRVSGSYVGWGFQLQDVRFVGFLAVLFLVLGLSFFDLWTWTWVPRFASKSASPLMTGVLAVLIASPCTAPLMGAAIGFALSQSISVTFLIFTVLGLGMSLPFLMFAVLPGISGFLPRPGAWMVTFKKAMGVMLVATSIWLVWLVVQISSVSGIEDNSQWTPLKVSEWDQMIQQKGARFVNFTAAWCVSCKVNEKVTFADSEVQRFFVENQVHLYKIDWTKREDAIGRKLAEYGRAGVPLYLFFSEGSESPKVLPELLTPQLLLSKLKSKGESQ